MTQINGYITPRLSWPRPATPTDLRPAWAGEFVTFEDWVSFARNRLTGTRDPMMGAEIQSVCIDSFGRRCTMSGHFSRARDEGAFPVRFFWDCAPDPDAPEPEASPAATVQPERRSPWRPIADLPAARALDGRQLIAITADGRHMLWTPPRLHYAMSPDTPRHLQFPATYFMWLADLPAPEAATPEGADA